MCSFMLLQKYLHPSKNKLFKKNNLSWLQNESLQKQPSSKSNTDTAEALIKTRDMMVNTDIPLKCDNLASHTSHTAS